MPEKTAFKRKTADESPGFLLYRVTILWQGKLGAIFDSFRISQTQYAILASLLYFEEKGEQSTQTSLVEHARIDKMTLSKAVRGLESARLVARQTSQTDNRAVLVSLTTRGRKLTKEAVHAVESADEEFFVCMSEKQGASFREIALALIKGNTAR